MAMEQLMEITHFTHSSELLIHHKIGTSWTILELYTFVDEARSPGIHRQSGI